MQKPSPLPPIVYGEISILGYNGYIPATERGGRKNISKFLLCKRPQSNGIKKAGHYIVKQPNDFKLTQDKDYYSISYTFSRSQTILVEYQRDENTDMFQIGRSSEDPIDFVITDTLPRNSNNLCKRSLGTQSTISRFACRILVDRKPPYTARIYAAGFDFSKNIFLGEKATKWEQDNVIDGLTTNGVLLMHPKRGYFYDRPNAKKSTSDLQEPTEPQCQDDQTTDDHNKTSDTTKDPDLDKSVGGKWREVSVDGGIYAIRESRSAPQKGTRIYSESNILQDGTLIDLCGATLLWRSLDGFVSSPTRKSLEEKIELLNASRPQCPVGLNTLIIPRKPIIPPNHNRGRKSDGHHHHLDNNNQQHQHHHNHQHQQSNHHRDSEKNSHQPYVYIKCGHVQGYHNWGATEKSNQRTCPICRSVGTVARLSMGLEPSFYIDSGPLTHAFNPCGHMASEKTVKYWSSIKIPHGTHFFHSICPFCATPLATDEATFTRLIFQDDLD